MKYVLLDFKDSGELDVLSPDLIQGLSSDSDVLDDSFVNVVYPSAVRGHKKRMKYQAHVVKCGDSREELEAELERMLADECQNNEDLGRGHRLKKRKAPESDSESVESVPSKGKCRKLGEAEKIKKSQVASSKDMLRNLKQMHASSKSQAVEEVQMDESGLREENKQLKMENEQLRSALCGLTALPETVKLLQDLLAASSFRNSRVEHPETTPSDQISAQSSVCEMLPRRPSSASSASLSTVSAVGHTQSQDAHTISLDRPLLGSQDSELRTVNVSELAAKCSKSTAQKFVNDLLHSMYSRQYLATHSLTGAASSRGTAAKAPLPDDDVRSIISEPGTISRDGLMLM